MQKPILVDENGKVKKFDLKAEWAKAKAKAAQIWETCKENKEIVIAVGSVVIPAGIEIVKMSAKRIDRKTEDTHRRKEMWDPVEGHWWKLKRELSSREYLEVENRVKNGEKRGEVLYDMGVLK